MVTEEITRERARSREEVRLSHGGTKFGDFRGHGGNNAGARAVTGRGTALSRGDEIRGFSRSRAEVPRGHGERSSSRDSEI